MKDGKGIVICDDGVDLLVTAIVKRAVEDIINGHPYVDWPEERLERIIGTKRETRVKSLIRESEDAKRFLRSNWFSKMFPNTDGEMLIRMADEEWREQMGERESQK